jgi:3-hydroxyacyl-[acyl-carrier-protein] dehydratase
MAQLSGVLAFETKDKRPADGVNYLFGGVEKARFRRPVIPGDRLDMVSKIIADRSRMMKFECSAYVDEALACSAVLSVVEQRT